MNANGHENQDDRPSAAPARSATRRRPHAARRARRLAGLGSVGASLVLVGCMANSTNAASDASGTAASTSATTSSATSTKTTATATAATPTAQASTSSHGS